MKLILTLLLALLCACVPTNPTRPLTVHQRYEAACVNAGVAYGVIIAANRIRTLSASTQAQVLQAKKLIDQRCALAPGEDYPYTATAAALAELEGASDTLTLIKESVQ